MAATFAVRALAGAAMLALAACSTTTPEPRWRIEPTARVDDARSASTGNAAGHLALARQYEGERRFEQALHEYRKAAQAAPWDVDVLNALGIAEAQQGEYPRAVMVLRRAAALAPQRSAVLNNLGYALLLNGQPAEARGVLQLALERQPGHALAKKNLAQAKLALEAQAPATPTTPAVAPQPLTTQTMQEQALPPSGPAPAAVPAGALVSATHAPAPTNVRLEVTNGNGTRGMAAWMATWLRQRGVDANTRLSNLRPYNTESTVVQYREGFAAQAREIARRMPASVEIAVDPRPNVRSDVRIVLGRDLRTAAVASSMATMVASR